MMMTMMWSPRMGVWCDPVAAAPHARVAASTLAGTHKLRTRVSSEKATEAWHCEARHPMWMWAPGMTGVVIACMYN